MEDTISRKMAIDAMKSISDSICEQQAIDALCELPSAQPETHDKRTETHACDCISRQAAIEAIEEMQMPIMRSMFPEEQFVFKGMSEALSAIKDLPSAQPVDKDVKQTLDEVYAHAETEAEARFHDEIVRCKDCKHQVKEWRADKRLKDKGYMVCGCDVVGDACGYWALLGQDDDFCSYAERRNDGV